MCIVDEQIDFSVEIEEREQVCTCRHGYAFRKDGSRIDHRRVDPFCGTHGYRYRREIASAYCRSFNRRRHFSNFILHLGRKADAKLVSWAKGYVTDLIRGHFDKDAIIKAVLHPKDGDHHLHFGVGSQVGHVTLAALLNAKSRRGRKPRLDLESAWVDGCRRDQPWNWSAYVLRIDEGWRPDERVNRRFRRSWRSRAEKGCRIKAPTISGGEQPRVGGGPTVDAENLIPVDADDVLLEVALSRPSNSDVDDAQVVATPESTSGSVGDVLVRELRWKGRRWYAAWEKVLKSSSLRISPLVGVFKDDLVGEAIFTSQRPRALARPPPHLQRPPPDHDSDCEDMMPSISLFTSNRRVGLCPQRVSLRSSAFSGCRAGATWCCYARDNSE